MSEWFNLNDNELDAINTFILSNNPINNLYNNVDEPEIFQLITCIQNFIEKKIFDDIQQNTISYNDIAPFFKKNYVKN